VTVEEALALPVFGDDDAIEIPTILWQPPLSEPRDSRAHAAYATLSVYSFGIKFDVYPDGTPLTRRVRWPVLGDGDALRIIGYDPEGGSIMVACVRVVARENEPGQWCIVRRMAHLDNERPNEIRELPARIDATVAHGDAMIYYFTRTDQTEPPTGRVYSTADVMRRFTR
jgi:hypothetical protein